MALQNVFINPEKHSFIGEILNLFTHPPPLLLKIFSSLKPHQLDGIQFLVDRADSGAILAHSMGLGKTLQAIVFMLYIWLSRKEAPPPCFMILCPAALTQNWNNELKKWLKHANSGGNATAPQYYSIKQSLLWLRNGGILVVSYNTFAKKLPHSNLSKCNPYLIFCDEAHVLKNEKGKMMNAVASISTRRKFLLTGTPIQNHLTEYHTVLSLVSPHSLLGNVREFKRKYQKPITKSLYTEKTRLEYQTAEKQTKDMERLVGSYVHRRGLDELNHILPKKYEFVIMVLHSSAQQRFYKDIRRSRQKNEVAKLESIFEIFNQDLIVGTYPPLPSLDLTKKTTQDYKNSSKLRVLVALVDFCCKHNEKIIIFSQSRFSLEYISMILQQHLGVSAMIVHGDVRELDRSAIYTKFSSTSTNIHNVLLISIKIGALGLNLVAANRIVLFDVSWNPAYDMQATYRIYRMGQERACYIYRFVSYGTMEEKIYQRQITKDIMSNAVMDKIRYKPKFTEEELKNIPMYENFEPESMNMWATTDPSLDPALLYLDNHCADLADCIVAVNQHNDLFVKQI